MRVFRWQIHAGHAVNLDLSQLHTIEYGFFLTVYMYVQVYFLGSKAIFFPGWKFFPEQKSSEYINNSIVHFQKKIVKFYLTNDIPDTTTPGIDSVIVELMFENGFSSWTNCCAFTDTLSSIFLKSFNNHTRNCQIEGK